MERVTVNVKVSSESMKLKWNCKTFVYKDKKLMYIKTKKIQHSKGSMFMFHFLFFRFFFFFRSGVLSLFLSLRRRRLQIVNLYDLD